MHIFLNIRQRLVGICLFVALSFFMSGCSITPLNKQFVSAQGDLMLSQASGTCGNGLPLLATGSLTPADCGLNPESIGVLDWNTYKGKLPGWQSDLLSLSEKNDIIVLQEASKNDQMEDFLRLRNLYWSYNSAFRYKGVETGVLIASVDEPVYSCGLRQNEPIIGVPKTAIVSLYPIKGESEQLLVANVHGINITFGTGAYRKQFEAVERILLQHDGPMVLVGDFNNWSEKRKQIVDELADNLELTQVPFEHENRTVMWGDPVDHVLYRGLKPIEHVSYSVTSSDHNPIEVRFRLERKADKNQNIPIKQ